MLERSTVTLQGSPEYDLKIRSRNREGVDLMALDRDQGVSA